MSVFTNLLTLDLGTNESASSQKKASDISAVAYDSLIQPDPDPLCMNQEQSRREGIHGKFQRRGVGICGISFIS